MRVTRGAIIWGILLAGWVMPPAAQAQLGQIELALKLRGYYAKGKFIYNSPKYLQNYEDCRAKGESDEFCRTLTGICAAQEQPFFGGPYASLFRGLGLNQVFKLNCGSDECFQCCHVPGMGCHTSFIGFPVINCNERYGVGTRPAGITLVTDPDPQPGEACLTIPQTCEHIPRCASEPGGFGDLRDQLDGGADHPLRMPGAAESRGRYFAQSLATKWCEALDRYDTSLPPDPEMPSLERISDLQDFLTGRGCVGWRANVGAAFPFDWEAEWAAVFDAEGVLLPASSQRNALCQWGLIRALESVPHLGERLSFVQSTVWPDLLLEMYLAQVDDPDEAILRSASPVVLDLLRCVYGIYDYRLLAVPLPDEERDERVFNGCELGDAPRVELSAESLGDGRLALDVMLEDPEVGGPHEAEVPLTIFWGDGRVSLESIPAGQAQARFEHVYDQPGPRKIIAMAENTSGLRGFGAVIGAVEGAGVSEGPVVVSELRLADVVVQADTLTGNDRTLFVEIEGHDAATDLSYRVGMTRGRPITLNQAVELGTWVGYNTGAAPLDRFTLRLHWREGFYTGLRQVTLRASRLELHVFSTETGESVAIEVPISPETIRMYAPDADEPLPPETILDEEGAPRLVLHTQQHRVERIEIDVPQALLAAQAPGPLPEGYPALNETAWYEDRPGQFRVVGDAPDMGGEGDPDGGIGMGGAGGAPSADGGVGQGDAEPSGCAVGARPGSAGWLSLLLGLGLLGWRRRRSE